MREAYQENPSPIKEQARQRAKAYSTDPSPIKEKGKGSHPSPIKEKARTRAREAYSFHRKG